MNTETTLFTQDIFAERHIGPSASDVAEMLSVIGVGSVSELIEQIVPKAIYKKDHTMPLPQGMDEYAALGQLKSMANKNKLYRSFIGMGYADTITPPVIQRNLLENPAWYTAYTPYQPEISQGRLEALLNFQQVIIDLTKMDLANASLLDEATAAAEAMSMMDRTNKKSKSRLFLISDALHPQTIEVLQTRATPMGITLQEFSMADGLPADDAFGVILQYPDTYGQIHDIAQMIAAAQERNMPCAVAADLLSLCLLTPPGEMGADIVFGAAQRFGVPLGFGGPHAAFFAFKDQYKRNAPGRIVGVSTDRTGKAALRLALQTREQHIRRDKATSNICTAQVLLANIAAMYAVYHGPEGLKRIATQLHQKTCLLAEHLNKAGLTLKNTAFFDTLHIINIDADALIKRAVTQEINLRKINAQEVGVTLDEKTTAAEICTLIDIFTGDKPSEATLIGSHDAEVTTIPSKLQRQSSYLTHPTFQKYHSETEMIRYLRHLAQKDIALDRSMIPLGSCTMKLNASAEMMPVSWPAFTDIHPFAPVDQAQGYIDMIDDLRDMLAKATGFADVSFQPNAGSQGEYAGLLTIAAYHQSRDEAHRNICLIPSSAHGTNPASAVMAGMKVVIVKCDDMGNIDVADLKDKAEQHQENLAALMVTYPSTHGVFEEEITEICDIIHQNGGQVYMDGANLNALLGLAYPGEFGADVMHMNLHKTFCIPHGGGGPGVGPIGLAAHLAPFAPGHNFNPDCGGDQAITAVSAAPYGSALILPITWMYMKMMGGEGLKKATEVAIVNANYLATSLAKDFKTLYTGQNGYVAHECIIDTRHLMKEVGVSVDDIAKRLMDFGFHAPTMSFPVVHTLMIEPTESESKAEIDRFITAMRKIAMEIEKIRKEEWSQDDNPLHHAPHDMATIMSSNWSYAYSREEAAYPASFVAQDKYWPPVSRIDNAAGDRNLICTCPDISAYEDIAA